MAECRFACRNDPPSGGIPEHGLIPAVINRNCGSSRLETFKSAPIWPREQGFADGSESDQRNSNGDVPWTPGHRKPPGILSGRWSPRGRPRRSIRVNGSSDLVTVVAKDDITAGDGAKHDIIPDKGRLATATTCNVFRLLKACGLPVAFDEQDSAISFIAPQCAMLPYEVVVRREAHGSLSQAQSALRQGAAVPAADRRVLPQDQGQELEGQAARLPTIR